MNKTEFVKLIADQTQQPTKQINQILSAILENVTKMLAEGDNIKFAGFGSFKIEKKAVKNDSPQVKIPAREIASAGKKKK